MDVHALTAWVRDRLIDLLPDALDFIPTSWPDWALFLAAPAVILVLAGLFLHWLFDTLGKVRKGFAKARKFARGESTDDPAPATSDQVDQLQRDLQAQLATVIARLDAANATAVAAGAAQPLGAEEKGRRDAAVGEVLGEQTPASSEFAQDALRGDATDAIEALERAARAKKEGAAEDYRRIGAIARGVDDAKALAAYEEAFRLQPEDFWTCVELARLYRVWKGDIATARTAAGAAGRAARGDREQSVAHDELGDVLVKAGDLEGAKARFEACNAILEKLAAQNPGSAEAQRDVSVSFNKLGDVLVQAGDLEGAKARFAASLAVREKLAAQNPGSAEAQRDLWVSLWRLAKMDGTSVRWAQVLERMEAMKARGVLFPTDEQFLEQARAHAVAEQARP
ncbi:MAG TPA: hypothetical protein VG943_13575 [Caulobacterales bacterium]|nr:hypothetical protein [Caulobacterales bacterium]